MKLLGLSGLAAMASANMLDWNEKRCMFRPNHQAVRGRNCAFNLNTSEMTDNEFECYFRNEFYAGDGPAECGGSKSREWVVVDVRTADEQSAFSWPTKNSFANRVAVSDPSNNLEILTCQNADVCKDNRIQPFFNILSGQFANQDGNMCGNAFQTNRARHNGKFHGYDYMRFFDGMAAGSDDFGLIMVCGASHAAGCDDMAHNVWSFFDRRYGADINIRMTTDMEGLAARMENAALAADGEGSFCGSEVANWRSLEHDRHRD